MTFPSWIQFTTGLSNFEKNVNDRRSGISYRVRVFLNRHSTLDKIVNASLPFLPPPFNEIAKAIYNSFEASDKAIGEVLTRLRQIEKQGENNYNNLTPRLDNIHNEIIHMNNTAAKESTLLNMQEILISASDVTNEKIASLESKIVDLENLWQEANIRFGKILGLVDENYSAFIASIKNKPVTSEFPSVIARVEEGHVVFRSVYFKDQVLRRVTVDNLKEIMDPERLLVFRAYEKSMEINFKEWLASKSKGISDSDPQFRDIARRICSDWGKMIKILGSIGSELDDHYGHIYDICRDNGMLIEESN
jgi:hypothetical protein